MPLGRGNSSLAAPASNDTLGCNHDVQRHVVLGPGQVLVEQLHGMDGADHRRARLDHAGRGGQAVFEVSKAAALADPHALAVDRHRTRDHQVNGLHLVDVNWPADTERPEMVAAFAGITSGRVGSNSMKTRSSLSLGTAMYSSLPCSSASWRNGRCAWSGLLLMARADSHSGSSEARAAASSLPMKLGILS